MQLLSILCKYSDIKYLLYGMRMQIRVSELAKKKGYLMLMRHKPKYNRARNAAIGNTKEIAIRKNKQLASIQT